MLRLDSMNWRRHPLVFAWLLLWLSPHWAALPLSAGPDPLEEHKVARPARRAGNPSQFAMQQRFPLPDVRTPPLSRKRQRDLLKHNFEKMKRDADELLDLAKSLQEELNRSNENVLSLAIVEKAKKIEKLAKGIKDRAKGF